MFILSCSPLSHLYRDCCWVVGGAATWRRGYKWSCCVCCCPGLSDWWYIPPAWTPLGRSLWRPRSLGTGAGGGIQNTLYPCLLKCTASHGQCLNKQRSDQKKSINVEKCHLKTLLKFYFKRRIVAYEILCYMHSINSIKENISTSVLKYTHH